MSWARKASRAGPSTVLLVSGGAGSSSVQSLQGEPSVLVPNSSNRRNGCSKSPAPNSGLAVPPVGTSQLAAPAGVGVATRATADMAAEAMAAVATAAVAAKIRAAVVSPIKPVSPESGCSPGRDDPRDRFLLLTKTRRPLFESEPPLCQPPIRVFFTCTTIQFPIMRFEASAAPRTGGQDVQKVRKSTISGRAPQESAKKNRRICADAMPRTGVKHGRPRNYGGYARKPLGYPGDRR